MNTNKQEYDQAIEQLTAAGSPCEVAAGQNNGIAIP